jgi:hypothetical protein
MPESPEAPQPKQPAKKRKPRTVSEPSQIPQPAPLVDFGEEVTPEIAQDEPEEVATSEPAAPDGGTPTPVPGALTHL